MSEETYVALGLFSVVTSITPGPNNLMLLNSGLSFGWRRTLPHLFGITFGFIVLLNAVGLGLGTAFTAYPPAHLILKFGGAAYLLYLAWRIANCAGPHAQHRAGARPMTFLQAALFQWVNPKAWVMALTGMAMFTEPDHPFASMWPVSLVFAAFNLPSIMVWVAGGTVLRGLLAKPIWLRRINVAMGVLLAATVIPLLRT